MIFIYFGKYFKNYGNINAICTFWHGLLPKWPCHMTQAEDLSSPYLKCYCPSHLRKVTTFRGSAASLTEVIKRQSEGGQNLPPPPHVE